MLLSQNQSHDITLSFLNSLTSGSRRLAAYCKLNHPPKSRGDAKTGAVTICLLARLDEVPSVIKTLLSKPEILPLADQ